MNKNIYDVIRKNIKKYRKLQGLTQAQLAEKANISHDFLRQIESLKAAKNFSVQTIYDISLALKIDIGKFFKE